MDDVYIILLILNPILLGFIAYLSIRKLRNMIPETIESLKIDVKKEFEAWLNSETGQRAIYTIGAIIGNGAKEGFGMGKKGGKFKWQDLLGEIIGGYAKQKLGLTEQGETPAPSKESVPKM